MPAKRPAIIGILAVLIIGIAGAVLWLLLRPETPAAEPPPADEPEPVVAPLTGGVIDEPIEHAVMATKVANNEQARPQTGLAQADIVFEVVTEGGITRFIALFHSSLPDEVGPVRSAREIDIDLLPPYQPILAVSGGRDEVMSAARDHLEVIEEGPGFFRSDDRPAPHNLYLRPEEVLDLVDGPAPPQEPVWTFDEEVPAGGTPATELSVALSPRAERGWSFDEAEGLYRRLQDGEPHEVVPAGEIGASNVVILGAVIEPREDELVDIRIIGEGDAIVLRDGERFDVRWEKGARDEHIVLLTEDGEAFPLRPGPTWVLIPPEENLPSPPS